MHAPRLSSGLRGWHCTVSPAATATRTYLHTQNTFRYRGCASARVVTALHGAADLNNASSSCSAAAAPAALSTPRRLLSSGNSQRPPSSTSDNHPLFGVGGEAGGSAPAWVSSHKQNGERRMSVSIRSGAQRQRARRPPNVPPHAPPPPPPSSSIHPSAARNRGLQDVAATSLPSSPSKSEYQTSSEGPSSMSQWGKASEANLQPPAGSYSFVAGDSNSPLSSARPGAAAKSSASGGPPPSSSDAATPAAAAPSNDPTSTSASAAAAARQGPAEREERPTAEVAPQGYAPPSSGGAMPAANAVYSAAAGDASSSNPLLYSVSRFTEPVKRIILIRNGRSEANEDVAAYVHTPDWRIPLVEEGKRESIAAGRALSELTGDDPVYFYYSPYIRSRQSLRYVLQGYDEARLSGRSHTREWWEEEEAASASASGGFDNFISTVNPAAAANGGGSGVLNGRPIAGSSEVDSTSYADGDTGLPLEAAGIATTCAEDAGLRGGEVADAVATDPTTDTGSASFLQKEASLVLDRGTSDSIIGVREDVRLRDGDIGRYTTVEELMHHLLERERYGKFFYRFPYGESGADVCDRVTSFLDAFQRERVEFPMNTNVVIITHGLTMRMFIKRWFHLTVETFHRMKSPPPGSLCTLTRLHHRSCFRLDESCVESMHLPLSLNEYNGYKYRNKQLLGSMSSGAPYM